MKFINIKNFKSVSELQNTFLNNDPYPFIVIDNFLKRKFIEKLNNDFNINTKEAIHYKHFSEDKKGLTKYDTFSPFIQQLINELYSEEFIQILSELTNNKNLKGDFELHGGGLHQVENNGFLKIHRDFGNHPSNIKWKRKINLLLYINPIWNENWNGNLEFWNEKLTKQIISIEPIFNRCVLFDTTNNMHGHPHPLKTENGIVRKSLALYYFEETKVNQKVKSTYYTAIQEDSLATKLIISLDRKLVLCYNLLKRYAGLNDKSVDKLLKLIRKFFGK
jgi:Rps23 Pro-64 3,4-dihydroxylase Tpa1-like proline 4-hydroxylase